MYKIFKPFLLPVWLIYGLIVFIRNKLFDFKILKSEEFHLPVISVGNITVGGTGKTPHVEYLINLLKEKHKVALLSRGYKRKTSGFIVATEQSTTDTIGDEPRQVKRKFPEITVAVDKNRVNGINKLLKNVEGLDIVILDDAYQHRYVEPGINILLIDYNRPINEDYLLPIGRLREPEHCKSRADIIIFTKVPQNLTPTDRRLATHNIKAEPHQKIYFSTLTYGKPVPVFEDNETVFDFENKNLSVLLVTGIANPEPLYKYLKQKYNQVVPLYYPDHYNYTANDISVITEKFQTISDKNKVIITTEKDAVRLTDNHISKIKTENWFYIPVQIEFSGNEEEQINHQILHYVSNNSRNNILYKK